MAFGEVLMRNIFAFIAWTNLLVIVVLAGIGFYIVSTSDGTSTYAQMGYDTGRYFVEVLIGSVIFVALGKRFSFLPGFTHRKRDSDAPTV